LSVADEVRSARTTAALFTLEDRGVVEVRGRDRVRFLQGQLTNDVAGLDPAGARSGCHALVLTPQGRIVADLHVLARPDAIWLETDRAAVPALIARLAKYVIADDVAIADHSTAWVRFGVEGPRAAELAAAAAGVRIEPEPDACVAVPIAGVDAVVAAFGWSGEPALQWLVPAAARAAAATELEASARRSGAALASAEALEVLRIEAGIPRFGAELGEQTLPAEVHLVERAVSLTKGCYTGQEIVARMQSRGRVGHLLVGLSCVPASGSLPAPGTALWRAGSRVGEITSAACSPTAGAIALGFVRAAHAEPGTRFDLEDGTTTAIVPLPFVTLPLAARRTGPG
jgi:folate-binding protein YgfZ